MAYNFGGSKISKFNTITAFNEWIVDNPIPTGFIHIADASEDDDITFGGAYYTYYDGSLNRAFMEQVSIVEAVTFNHTISNNFFILDYKPIGDVVVITQIFNDSDRVEFYKRLSVIEFVDVDNVTKWRIELDDTVDRDGWTVTGYFMKSNAVFGGECRYSNVDTAVTETGIKPASGKAVYDFVKSEIANIEITGGGTTGLDIKTTQFILAPNESATFTAETFFGVGENLGGTVVSTNGATLTLEDETALDVTDNIISLADPNGDTYYFIAELDTSLATGRESVSVYFEDSYIPVGADIKRLLSLDGGATWLKSDYVMTLDPDGANNTSTTNSFPALTSNTSEYASYGVAFGSVPYSVSAPIWHAFNEVYTTSNITGTFGTHTLANPMVGFLYNTPIVSNKYIINGSNYGSELDASPRTWTFQGSTDTTDGTDGNWDTLDTRTNETGWSTAEARTYTFTNSTAYKAYKLVVTATNGDATLFLSGLKIIEAQGSTSGTGALTATSLDSLQTDGHTQFELKAMLEDLDDLSNIDSIQMAYALTGGASINANTSYISFNQTENIKFTNADNWRVDVPKVDGDKNHTITNTSGETKIFEVTYSV
jgi:hypothetical protein